VYDHDLHADVDYCETRPFDSRLTRLKEVSPSQWREEILPQVYSETRAVGFKMRQMLPWLFIGAVQSAINLYSTFLIPSHVNSAQPASFSANSVALYTTTFFTVQSVISSQVNEWTWLYVLTVVANTCLYFGFVFVWDGFKESTVNHTAHFLFSGASFWICLPALLVACFLPILSASKVSTYWWGKTALLTNLQLPVTKKDSPRNLL